MYNRFKVVKIDSEYCNYLRKFDKRVPYNYGRKELRPYVGILFKIEDIEYFAPFSSPKEKHLRLSNTLDLIKINNGTFGVINFNNMIPVTKNCYVEFDLNLKNHSKSERQRIILIRKQLRWINNNSKEVSSKSHVLYTLYLNNKLPSNVKDRCCNFPLLEEKCNDYNKIKVNQ
mgnify:CR=1 FL=1